MNEQMGNVNRGIKLYEYKGNVRDQNSHDASEECLPSPGRGPLGLSALRN